MLALEAALAGLDRQVMEQLMTRQAGDAGAAQPALDEKARHARSTRRAAHAHLLVAPGGVAMCAGLGRWWRRKRAVLARCGGIRARPERWALEGHKLRRSLGHARCGKLGYQGFADGCVTTRRRDAGAAAGGRPDARGGGRAAPGECIRIRPGAPRV